MSGYSGTPLAKKLGIAPGGRVYLHDAPAHYAELVAPLPAGARMVSQADAGADLLHVFSHERAVLGKLLKSLRTRMRPDAALWVSWPKKSSGVATDLTEDVIRSLALPLGLVDIKVCAVDETWSGLKLVIRKSERSAAARVAAARSGARRGTRRA
jgi:hypothetical protein